jgi:hypothetical protein
MAAEIARRRAPFHASPSGAVSQLQPRCKVAPTCRNLQVRAYLPIIYTAAFQLSLSVITARRLIGPRLTFSFMGGIWIVFLGAWCIC